MKNAIKIIKMMMAMITHYKTNQLLKNFFKLQKNDDIEHKV